MADDGHLQPRARTESSFIDAAADCQTKFELMIAASFKDEQSLRTLLDAMTRTALALEKAAA